MSKYRQVLYEAVDLKSTNRGFKSPTILLEHMNKLKKDSVTFTPKSVVLDDGIHAEPLNL